MAIKLREITESDCLRLFNWANEKDSRRNSLNQEPIEWEDHKKWFGLKMASPDSKIFILEDDDTAVGQVRYDKKNGFWEIAFFVDKEYRGKGYGKLLIEKSFDRIDGSIRAVVKVGNIASKKVFEGLNFKTNSVDENVVEYLLIK